MKTMIKIGEDVPSNPATEETEVVDDNKVIPIRHKDELLYQCTQYLELSEEERLNSDTDFTEVKNLEKTLNDNYEVKLEDMVNLAQAQGMQLSAVVSTQHYGDFPDKPSFEYYYKDTEEKLRNLGFQDNYIEEVIDGIYQNPDHPKLAFHQIMDRMENAINEATRISKLQKRQAELQENQERERASRDYTDDIKSHLASAGVHNVHPRELADELWSLLSETEKEKYYNRPMYATFKMYGTEEYKKALSTCLEKFNKSVVIDKTINEYLEKELPNRESNAIEIEKLAAACPVTVKTGDVRLDAYTVITSMSDNKGSDVSDDMLKDNPELLNELGAKIEANMEAGEPLDASVESACDTSFMDKLSSKIGRTLSKTSKTKENIVRNLKKSPEGTLREELERKRSSDDRLQVMYENILKERDKEKEELEKRLKEQDEKLRAMGAKQREEYERNHRYDYGYINHMYGQPQPQPYQYQQQQQPPKGIINTGNLTLKHYVIIFNAIFLLFLLLLNKIIHRSVFVAEIGTLIATAGLILLGKHKDSKRLIIGGYAIAFVGLLILCF